MRDLTKLGFVQYATLLGFLLISGLMLSVVIGQLALVNYDTLINAVGTVGSLFLSGLLVYIYADMSITQQKQFEAQQEQTNYSQRDRNQICRSGRWSSLRAKT